MVQLTYGYIQKNNIVFNTTRKYAELFGHKSSRITELYNHVSTQSLQKIKSLFDDL
jgi:hypothetical protein